MWDIGWHASKYSEYLHFQMYPERWNHLAYSLAEVFWHWSNISDFNVSQSLNAYFGWFITKFTPLATGIFLHKLCRFSKGNFGLEIHLWKPFFLLATMWPHFLWLWLKRPLCRGSWRWHPLAHWLYASPGPQWHMVTPIPFTEKPEKVSQPGTDYCDQSYIILI